MGFLAKVLLFASFAMSIAFNLYMADVIMRLRSDSQITRKRVHSIWKHFKREGHLQEGGGEEDIEGNGNGKKEEEEGKDGEKGENE